MEREVVIEGLEILKNLKKEVHELKDEKRKYSDEADKKINPFLEEISEEQNNLLKILKQRKYVEIHSREIDIGYRDTHYISSASYSWLGTKISDYEFFNYNFKGHTPEEMKKVLFDWKNGIKKDKIEELNSEMYLMLDEIEKLEEDKKTMTERRSNMNPLIRLFTKNKFDKELEEVNNKINELIEKRKKVKEEIKEFEETFISASEEEVNECLETEKTILSAVEKCKELRSKIKTIDEEKNTKQEQVQEKIDEKENNKKSTIQKLLSINDGGELVDFVSDPNNDKELVEIATAILKSAGLGTKRKSVL